MKALILAAGRGSRMGDLTDERPKCLLELRGRPLVEWQVEALRGAGASEVAIVTGYRCEELGHLTPVSFHNSRWRETNMVRTLACARDWLLSEPCVVSYADIVYPASAVRALATAEADVALTYDPDWLQLWSRRFDDPLDDAETFRLDEDSNLIEIGGRARTTAEIEGQFMGLVRFTPVGWAAVESLLESLSADTVDRLDTTSLLRRLIARGEEIEAVPVIGPWGEADSASDLEVLEQVWR